MTIFLRRFLWCATATTLLVGCSNFDLASHFDLKKNIPWGEGQNGEFDPPIKAAAMWTDTILNQGGKASLRGFGGRVMFYAAEGGKPIKVRGTLVVYAFDETGRDTEHVRPDRKYVFTPEQFEQHYSKSALGHSYSVWLPWDEAGGPRREISLLVRFTPVDGAAIVGDLSKHNLPGYSEADVTQYPPYAGDKNSSPAANVSPATNAPAAMNTSTGGGVVQVGYQAPLTSEATSVAASAVGLPTPANAENPSPRRMMTTTITLPPSQRVRGLGNGGYAGSPAGARAPAGEMPGYHAAAGTTNSSFGGGSNVGLAAAANSAAATPATAGVPEPQSAAHFGSPRRRPLGAPLDRLTRDHAPWQPSR